MEVESFENEEVAKLLNDWFVSIKVSVNLFDVFWYVQFWLGNGKSLTNLGVLKAIDLPYSSDMPLLQVDREERPDVDKVNEIHSNCISSFVQLLCLIVIN